MSTLSKNFEKLGELIDDCKERMVENDYLKIMDQMREIVVNDEKKSEYVVCLFRCVVCNVAQVEEGELTVSTTNMRFEKRIHQDMYASLKQQVETGYGLLPGYLSPFGGVVDLKTEFLVSDSNKVPCCECESSIQMRGVAKVLLIGIEMSE